MIKDIIQQNENITPNSKELAVLKEHFPACFTVNGSFDIERFKAAIADKTNVVQEGYELKFLGKSYAKLLASTDTTTVIQPNEAHNNLPENASSENIYISGDNLDGLKHLLKSYSKSIKCIYIDPPYNTGSDGFVYFDNFNYNKENLQEKLSVSEDEAERILDLTKRGSASHSAWLMFMYSRLLLARDLLTDDGAIFISIDDNEQANVKLLCDDVFGEENFVEQIIWRKKSGGGQQDDFFVTEHDYVTSFAKRKADFKINEKTLSKTANGYNKVDKLSGKKYKHVKLSKWGSAAHKEDRPTMYFSIKDPDGNENYPIAPDGRDGRWRFGKQSVLFLLEENKIEFVKNNDGEWIAYEKEFEPSEDDISILKERSIFYDLVENTSGSKELTDLFGRKDIFDNPKPTDLLYHLVLLVMGEDKGGIVCDFFSGSGSLAHAVLKLNVEYNEKINFIAIQLPEKIDSEKTLQIKTFEFLQENHLPKTLDYIGFERIKRAAAKIKQEYQENELDLGFKHYILTEPNQNTLDKLDSFDKAAMLADPTILDDFGNPTILATWLNADGYGLSTNAHAIDLAGYTAYFCQKHLYLIDPGFTLESMKALLKKYDAEGHFNPENLVLFGYSFPDWSINEMIEKNLRILNDSEKNLKINFNVRY